MEGKKPFTKVKDKWIGIIFFIFVFIFNQKSGKTVELRFSQTSEWGKLSQWGSITMNYKENVHRFVNAKSKAIVRKKIFASNKEKG